MQFDIIWTQFFMAYVMPYDVVVDVITTEDVITFTWTTNFGDIKEADVIALLLMWQMFKPQVITIISWQMLLPRWQME